MGPLILPTWSNLPSISACPRSVVVLQLFVGIPVEGSFLHTVIWGKYVKSSPPRLTNGDAGLGSPVPMSNGVGKEWLPTFGVSWQVPQVPCKTRIPPATRPPAATSSLI